jgi:predicted ATPase
MTFRLRVRNYRGLKEVDWSPSGVCALVGPNGSGKTTLLDVPALLRDALDRGLARALEQHGGIANARNVHAAEEALYDFMFELGAASWHVIPLETPSGFRPYEHVDSEGKHVVVREAGADSALVLSDLVPARDVLAFRIALDELEREITRPLDEESALALGRLLQRYRIYRNYDLPSLRRSGSSDSSERRLAQDGNNVFSVLRNWRDKRDDRDRYQFVLDGLREMFGDFFEDLDFSKAAQVVGAELRLRGDKLISASLAPDGWFVALLHLTAVASTDSGDLIAIDEPENALHPHAIKILLELMRHWSLRRSVTILLATHSPVILDTFKEEPGQLYVMEPKESPLPRALDKLKEPSWLAHFSLGDLYAREEIGAPVDDDTNRTDHDMSPAAPSSAARRATASSRARAASASSPARHRGP